MLLFLITLIGGFLRFYNLMWGEGFFFHPDERNMAISIAQMRIEDGLQPHFFAYGQFPLYLAYFSYQLVLLIKQFSQFSILNSQFSINPVPFPSAVLSLRFWSALTSTLTIPVVYLIMKELIKKHQVPITKLGNFAAILVAFTPGLIQAAHFGTTESLLTFFFMVIIYFSLKFLKTENLKYLLLTGIVSGIAMGTKLSAVFFIFAPLITIPLVCKKKTGSIFKKITNFLLFVICYLLFVICFLFLASPYNFLAFNDFIGTSTYETHVAQGKALTFYTSQFAETAPIVYQLTRIFPYALGWPMFIIGTLGFLYANLQLGTRFLFSQLAKIKKLKLKIFRFDMSFFIFSFSFLVYFIPNAFLYCKWTRFITPIMPFFAIFAGYFLFKLLKRRLVIGILVLACIIPGLLFFTIYTKPDIRAEASEWIYKNIPKNAYILSETANVVDIPLEFQATGYNLHDYNYEVISFDFYHVNESPKLFDELINHLETADYIFIPSQRLFRHRLRLAEKYPLTAQYYRLLFSGQLGFEKVAYFSRLPDEQAEETWSVFDHPIIRIYKKIKPFSKDEYQKLLKNY